ncbi:hypothetical protein M885DRAFT_527149 [Pelagophyceae sp. CCMP2097]|nr:hypothetical protein M885DRAFT_527149 [Pelagophyceae sp. CCMP2097]
MDYDINNSSVIPMIHAALMNEENRYEAVLKVARKARQRAVLEQMSGGPSDSEKPLLAQLREELEVYDARKREAQRAANAAMAAPVE